MSYRRFAPGNVFSAAQHRLFGRIFGTLTHVRTTEPVAALTFDDGPDPASTPKLLDILAKYQAASTFFMVGEAAQQYPELVRRVADEGHAIGNHTWSHAALPRLTHGERIQEIRRCKTALAPYGLRIFRPPYGEQNFGARFDLLRCRYNVVAWSTDSDDWWNPDSSAMRDGLLQRIRPGCIVLLHDSIHRPPEGHRSGVVSRPTQYDREAMLAALDDALQQLRSRFRFVTVPQLLQCGRPQRTFWSSWQDSPSARLMRRG